MIDLRERKPIVVPVAMTGTFTKVPDEYVMLILTLAHTRGRDGFRNGDVWGIARDIGLPGTPGQIVYWCNAMRKAGMIDYAADNALWTIHRDR